MVETIIIKNNDDLKTLDWKEIDRKDTFDLSGVYAFVNRDKASIDYVGQSVNIGQRLSRHVHDSTFDENEHYLLILELPNQSLRDYVEARCIHLIDPPMNKKSGNFSDEFKEIHARLAFSKRTYPNYHRSNIDDPVVPKGIGLKKSEWEELENIAEQLNSNVHAVSVWAIRDFIKKYMDGGIPIVIQSSLPGL